MAPRLKQKFDNEVCPLLAEEHGISNPMAMPRLQKVVLHVGLGKQLEGTKVNAAAKQQVLDDLAAISGQKPVMLKARKAVSNFKVRAGYEVGAMVTLRGTRMWEYLDRLINLAIPRIKDFRGLSLKSFDGRGNYSFGVTEQAMFLEINAAEIKFTHGMHHTIAFSNSTDELSRRVLRELGMPFTKPEDQQDRKVA